MKKQNSLIYVVKAIDHDMWGIWTAHVVDDNCIEYTATIRTTWLNVNHYYFADDLAIIDMQPYNSDQWQDWQEHAEFARIKAYK